jgi:hypothetical protein
MRTFREFWHGAESASGQALILIAISMLAMLMVVGLAIDAGQLYSARRTMQEAADAAAYAGSVVLYQGGTQAEAFSAATTDATTNGFTHGANSTTVTVSQPTTSPFNNANYVQVVITRQVQTTLVPAEAGLTSVTARAISGAEALNNQYAIIALDRNATASAFNGGTANITLTGGAILVNSSYSTGSGAAIGSSGTWSITCPSTNPCSVDVAGSTSGTFPAAAPGSPTYYNGVTTGHAPVADPFAGYPKPSTSGLNTFASLGAGKIGGTNTLRHGIYTVQVTGVDLCHGVYILKAGMGGDVSRDTTHTDPDTGLTCDGKVFLFNTQTNYPASGGTCSSVGITGNHDITLNAMNSGTYSGLLFYQDSACTNAVSLGSTAFDLNVTGTIYVPNAAFTISGGHPTIDAGQLVAKTIDLGAATVAINFTPSTAAQPKLPRLSQ